MSGQKESIVFRVAVLFCLIAISAFGNSILSQNASSQAPRRPYGVPEASLPCTPEEQAWWKELREAGNDLKGNYRAGDKQKKRFLSALRESTAKSLKPPIPNSRPVVLYKTEPHYTEAARRRGSAGTISIQAELLADGTVGDIKILQSLDPDLDESAAAAARKTIFLPAVKDREFVTAYIRLVMNFNLY